jgi:Leucine-rich repeat (LRR) protein
VELPEGLARLTNLRSLVVQDHSIAPSGAHVLNKLTGLTHLDLSGSPIISSADFSGMKNLTSMPSFLFDFLGETMRELSFSRTAIKEWHPGIRLMRTKGQLRRLDLSFTRISYLPPCILRDEACDVADESLDRGSSGGHSHELELLNLTGTPVSRKVDWSAHALGSRVVDILLSELAKWLPQVEDLVLAGNRLTRMPSNLAAFNGITLLNFSCNSDMRATKDPMDYWSPVIRLKSSLKILDLSNTGLSQTDFGPNKITCDVYRFFEDANAGGVEVVLLPQNRLQIFGLYPNTDSKQALCKHNKGLFLRAYWNIFKLIAGSQIAKVIGFDNEIIINNAEEIRDQVWDKYPDAYTQRGMFQILYESRKGSAAGLQNLRRVAIRDVRLSLMANETSTPILRLPELLKFQNLLDLDVKDSGWSNELFANVVTTLTRLTGLTVSQGRLTGKLPAGLWKLTRLKNLNILECGEYGDVSNISKLVDLTYLSLNGETGGSNFPSTIGKLSKLIYFRWLGNHKSGGIIPDGVSELVSMASFFIDDGNISGTIPRALFKMGQKKGKRQRISLINNRLHGLIPRISNLAYTFECEHNALSGFFPDAFNHTQMLVEFSAHNNRLEGRIPVGLPRNRFFCKLGLNNNFLSGPIPNELTEFDPSYFRWLDLSNNNFSGTVPEAFMRYVADDNVLVCLNLCGNPLLNLSRLEPASGNPLALALYKKLGQGRDKNGTLGNLTNAGPICQYGLSQQELLSPVEQFSLGLSTVNYSICEDGQGIRQRLGAFCETY